MSASGSGIAQVVQSNVSMIAIGLCILVAIGLFIANVAMLAQNGVMADSYSDLKGQISTIWSLGGVGILFSFIAIWIYYNSLKEQPSSIFVALVMSSLAIFISYSAMATAVIVKK
jgi:hypothetical protein